MKKRTIIIFCALLGVAQAQAFGQSDSITTPRAVSVDTLFDPSGVAVDIEEDQVVSGTDDINYTSSVPLAGSRTLNRMTQVITSENDYCHLFCEVEGLIGFDDAACGVSLAYVDKHWGVYGSWLAGYRSYWGSFGAVYRPIARHSWIDWQLYGGPAFGFNMVGFEMGTRLASGNQDSFFSWCSATTGVINLGGECFYTAGLSLDLSALFLLLLL